MHSDRVMGRFVHLLSEDRGPVPSGARARRDWAGEQSQLRGGGGGGRGGVGKRSLRPKHLRFIT